MRRRTIYIGFAGGVSGHSHICARKVDEHLVLRATHER